MHRNGKNAVDCGEKFTFHRVAPHNSEFSQKQRKHLAEYIMAELLQEASSIITSTPVKTAITITIVLLMIRRSLQILFPLHF